MPMGSKRLDQANKLGILEQPRCLVMVRMIRDHSSSSSSRPGSTFSDRCIVVAIRTGGNIFVGGNTLKIKVPRDKFTAIASPGTVFPPSPASCPYSTPIALLVPLDEKHDRLVQRLSLQMSSARERLIGYRVERRISPSSRCFRFDCREFRAGTKKAPREPFIFFP